MGPKPHTIVVGVDFTRASDVAITEAIRLANNGAAAELHLVYVVDPKRTPDSSDEPDWTRAEQALERAPDHLRLRLADLAAAEGACPLEVPTFVHVRLGERVETLHQVAVDYDADLLIVGSNGRGFVERFTLGSVSEKLVRKARCPVLVARPKDFEGLAKTVLPDQPYAPGQEPKYSQPHDVELHISTQRVEWSSVDHEGPTGVRIV